jgi:hypothetical protein
MPGIPRSSPLDPLALRAGGKLAGDVGGEVLSRRALAAGRKLAGRPAGDGTPTSIARSWRRTKPSIAPRTTSARR